MQDGGYSVVPDESMEQNVLKALGKVYVFGSTILATKMWTSDDGMEPNVLYASVIVSVFGGGTISATYIGTPGNKHQLWKNTAFQ